MRSKFKGWNSPQGHLRQNYTVMENTPRKEWVHKFVHILDPIAKNGHMKVELRHGTVSGDDLVDRFFITSSINRSHLVLDVAFWSHHDKANVDHPGIGYQTQGQSQDASASNLIVLSQILPGRVEGHYWAEAAYCPEASTMILSRPKNIARLKIRPLGSSQFGGGRVLIALNDCTKTSTSNHAPHGQDFR